MDPAINRYGHHLWHDYGLVEYFWEQADDGRWRGTHFSVQVHRLNDEIGYEIPQVVAEHDTPPPRVAFDTLAAELTVPLVAARSSDDDLYAYWQPDSTALVFVVTENPNPVSHVSTVPVGHVYRITAPHHAPDVDLRGVASAGMGAQARHLLTLDEAGGRGSTSSRPMHCVTATGGRTCSPTSMAGSGNSRCRDPRGSNYACGCSTRPPPSASSTGANWPNIGPGSSVNSAPAPSPPASTPSCPPQTTWSRPVLPPSLVTPAEVTAIDNWRSETLDTMRRLRHAKNLINAAENLPRPHDPKLATDLDRWIRLKPRLT
jgi:hypothetical protein